MTREQLTQYLESLVVLHSSQSAFASYLGISPQMVSDLLLCKRDPGPAVLEKLGLQKVVSYEKVLDIRPHNGG